MNIAAEDNTGKNMKLKIRLFKRRIALDSLSFETHFLSDRSASYQLSTSQQALQSIQKVS